MSSAGARLFVGICIIALVGALVAFGAVRARQRRAPFGTWAVWAASALLAAVVMTLWTRGAASPTGDGPALRKEWSLFAYFLPLWGVTLAVALVSVRRELTGVPYSARAVGRSAIGAILGVALFVVCLIALDRMGVLRLIQP
jgi:hypothetical protein